jgi:hypothetical protein
MRPFVNNNSKPFVLIAGFVLACDNVNLSQQQ